VGGHALSSFSKLLAYEACRILFRLGCDVRVYDPRDLPVKDGVHDAHTKVLELRALSLWSDGHVWVSPEQHGNLVSCVALRYFVFPPCFSPLLSSFLSPTRPR